MESVKENQKMSRKEIEFMKIKNTIKRFSGILFAMVLAAAFLLPVQAASYYKYNYQSYNPILEHLHIHLNILLNME